MIRSISLKTVIICQSIIFFIDIENKLFAFNDEAENWHYQQVR